MMALADETDEISRLLAAAAGRIAKVRFCWLLTAAGAGGVRPRPMGRLPRDADDDPWTLRFITDGASPKAAALRRGGEVCIIFQNDADDTFAAIAGKARLIEDKGEIGKRWNAAYDVYFPEGPERSNAIFVVIDAMRVELWIRGVTPEPFGMRTTIIERDAGRDWRLIAS
jgi:general stress protein 26